MSAPLSGRQSPPPEEQTGAQEQDVPSQGRIVQEYKPSPGHAKRESVHMRDTQMQSNPQHPLEQAEEKMKK